MIVCIIGNIGEGKNLTAVREMKSKNQLCYVNFDVNFKKARRLRISDIIIPAKNIKDYKVNWKFWDDARNENPSFSIYLDEVHNIIHSRGSMTKRNQLFSQWVSQIRKILSDSDSNHLYIISQTLSKIDKDFRDLAHVFIRCKKIEIDGHVYILNSYYSSIENLEMDRPARRMKFYGNDYFKYYDRNKIVNFSDAEEYI